MKVLVSGSSGLIGSALVARMRTRGVEVVRLVRPPIPSSDGAIRWDPRTGEIDAARLEGFDAVVHLAGESIAGLWTTARKKRIHESRTRGTKLLCGALAGCAKRPRVIVSASATGYYGSRGADVLGEDAPPGNDFLARVCRDWEEATGPASARGIRVVCVRTGLVLDPRGGMLARLLIPFRLGLGATIGSGEQYMSWLTLDDLVSIYVFALENEGLSGPINGASPNPATNREFTRVLARVLGRPVPFRIPAAVLRLAFGEMADCAFLASERAVPARLLDAGFRFADPDLREALERMLR